MKIVMWNPTKTNEVPDIGMPLKYTSYLSCIRA
jgi:hypothetical protein